jgi:prophage antirepressor-like protein
MSAIEQFTSSEFYLRARTINSEPWFVANDVCWALGLSNTSAACSRLDADEKGINSIDTPGGDQDVLFVSEAGMYSLVLRSDKPVAKTFKRWITHEVLSSIRKTGAYAVASAPVDPLLGSLQALVQVRAEQLALATKVEELDELARTIDEKHAYTAKRVEQLHAKVDARMPDSIDRTPLNPTTLGERLNPTLSGKATNELLRDLGYQWKQQGHWTPTFEGRPYAVVIPEVCPDGVTRFNLKWQARIVSVLEKRIARKGVTAARAALDEVVS